MVPWPVVTKNTCQPSKAHMARKTEMASRSVKKAKKDRPGKERSKKPHQCES